MYCQERKFWWPSNLYDLLWMCKALGGRLDSLGNFNLFTMGAPYMRHPEKKIAGCPASVTLHRGSCSNSAAGCGWSTGRVRACPARWFCSCPESFIFGFKYTGVNGLRGSCIISTHKKGCMTPVPCLGSYSYPLWLSAQYVLQKNKKSKKQKNYYSITDVEF